MELGALICTPNGKPHCMECPWKEFCRGRQEGRIEELPVKSKAKQRKIEEKTVLVIRDGDKVAIHKRPKKGLLAGLYELPNVCGFKNQEEVLSYVKDMETELKQAKPDRVFITHSGCKSTVVEPVRQYLQSLGIFAEILETRAGGVISSHCGPGTLGVLFIKASD